MVVVEEEGTVVDVGEAAVEVTELVVDTGVEEEVILGFLSAILHFQGIKNVLLKKKCRSSFVF